MTATTPVDIVAFVGSLRSASWARALLRAAAELLPINVRLTIWDGLGEVPSFNEDLESGPTPTAVADLRGLIETSDALVIATPEYNMAIPGILKNVLDWASRPYGQTVLKSKPVAVVGTSPLPSGGTSALSDVANMLTLLGAEVVEADLAVGQVHTHIDGEGQIADPELAARITDFSSRSQSTPARGPAPADAQVVSQERTTSMVENFDTLVDEASEVSVEGWEFSWLDGRATEERPSWGYQRLLSGKLATATAALDIQTGGGEVLAGAGADSFPSTLVATEGWPPNVAKATALLHPLGAVVVADREEPPLPFGDNAFDLVTSRHPATVHWTEIARVLLPGGTYFAQHVGGGANVEISEYFLGPFEPGNRRHHDVEADQGKAAGLEIVQCTNERLQLEFFDVGAVVFFLRKVIWTVPNFTVDRYRDRLKALHSQIERDGVFRSTTSRTIFELRKPMSP